ncbi:G kinase-anchoring protein 1 isoform X2 [Syngnathus typhle]|uniref:G kinase-anchoring protein 1 isoform X2 n=1 Tax=Syngnathus typhle TaxID=161592 RepID=UPI002A6998E8|nr:G kinase-anchoring protein 1 isoform X2 [Syngnathus typhle]
MVPTTASRFALLQIDSDSDLDNSGAVKKAKKAGSRKQRPEKSGGAKASQGNDKKKNKKKEQEQSEANEVALDFYPVKMWIIAKLGWIVKTMTFLQRFYLAKLRNLAFKKIPQKSDIPPPTMTLWGIASALLRANPAPNSAKPLSQEGWQEWKQRDDEMTSEMYEADLEKALILSKQEFEQNKQGGSNNHVESPKSSEDGDGGGRTEKKKRRRRKKNPKKTVSLQDFQAEGTTEPANRRQEKEEASNTALGLGQEDRFFNNLEDDLSQIVQQERRRKQYNGDTSAEHEPDPRVEQLKYELEKKDREIRGLKEIIAVWEDKYHEVKVRSGLFLRMLQQGEMNDKVAILAHVQELLVIKEELLLQVTSLHTALEQERSKVKCLQSEQPKHQGNKSGKKSSEADLSNLESFVLFWLPG